MTSVLTFVVVAMVTGLLFVRFRRYRKRPGTYRPQAPKILSNGYPLTPANVSYSDDLDYYGPCNSDNEYPLRSANGSYYDDLETFFGDDVFTERTDVKDVGEMPRKYFKSGYECDRQIGIPYDDVLCDTGSMARCLSPIYEEDQLSQCPHDSIYSTSSSSDDCIFTRPYPYITSPPHAKSSMTRTAVSHRTRTTRFQLPRLSSYHDRHFESRRPKPSSGHKRRRTSRSLSPIPSSRHDRTSRSLSPIPSSRHDRTSRSLSPIPSSRHDRTSRSLSPIPSSRHDRRSTSLWFHDRMSEEQSK